MRDTGTFTTGRDYWDAPFTLTPGAKNTRSAATVAMPHEGNPVDITLLVLARDNEDTIIATLDTVLEAMDVIGKTFELLVIDDASQDRTVDMVRGYMIEFPQLNIVLRSNKKPKGIYPNYVDGAFIGCGQYYRLVHGDNSESVETMTDVLRSLGEADILVPYFISMHKKKSAGFSWLLNRITGHQINTYTGLHVHLRYSVMRWRSNSSGAFFQADLLCQLLDFGFTCKQVPCRAVPQRPGIGSREKFRNAFSAAHTILDVLLRRFSSLSS